MPCRAPRHSPAAPRRSWPSPAPRAVRPPCSPGPTTARSARSSAPRSRRTSRPVGCPPWSRRAASSSASTWARSTSSSRSSRRRRWPAGCSGSAGPATRSAPSSRGVLFPKFRGDLVQTAVVVERMRAGPDRGAARARATRSTCSPSRSSRCARWTSGPSTTCSPLVRRAAPFATLTRPVLESVLDMLAGRYPSDEFAELRAAARLGPRDRHPHRPPRRAAARRHLRRHHPRPRAVRRLPRRPARAPAAGSASSTRRWSTSRGSATCSPSARRPGASRTSPTTGCSSRPRPACPGGCRSGRATRSAAPPSWAGRSARSSARSRRCRRQAARERVTAAGLDDWAADNLLAYLREQREATGHVPDDRTIVVERFRDELGDWRVVVHSPFGAQVHAPWALAVARPDARAVRRRRAGDARRRRHRAAAARHRARRARRRARARGRS